MHNTKHSESLVLVWLVCHAIGSYTVIAIARVRIKFCYYETVSITNPRDFLLGVDLVVFGRCSEIEISFAVAAANAHSVDLVFARSTVEAATEQLENEVQPWVVKSA